MSLRAFVLVLVVVPVWLAGCAKGPEPVLPGEPQTAREKQRQEAKRAGELDRNRGDKGDRGWRYQGDRKHCFYVVGADCFKTKKAACRVANCQAPQKCKATGAGPAIVECQ